MVRLLALKKTDVKFPGNQRFKLTEKSRNVLYPEDCERPCKRCQTTTSRCWWHILFGQPKMNDVNKRIDENIVSGTDGVEENISRENFNLSWRVMVSFISNPAQNGVAEWMNRTIVESTQSIFSHARIPNDFRAQAANTSVYFRNPTTTLIVITIEEIRADRNQDKADVLNQRVADKGEQNCQTS